MSDIIAELAEVLVQGQVGEVGPERRLARVGPYGCVGPVLFDEQEFVVRQGKKALTNQADENKDTAEVEERDRVDGSDPRNEELDVVAQDGPAGANEVEALCDCTKVKEAV